MTERKLWLHQNIHKFMKFSVDTLENKVLQVTSITSSTFFLLQISLVIVLYSFSSETAKISSYMLVFMSSFTAGHMAQSAEIFEIAVLFVTKF